MIVLSIDPDGIWALTTTTLLRNAAQQAAITMILIYEKASLHPVLFSKRSLHSKHDPIM
jgi:hypothetical protein